METDENPDFAKRQYADEVDDIVVGAELAKVEKALLSDDGSDKQSDENDDGHGPHAHAVELMNDRDPPKASRGEEGPGEEHDERADHRGQSEPSAAGRPSAAPEIPQARTWPR